MNPIIRQGDQYGLFERAPHREAPQEIVAEFTRGRSVGAGMLNPRGVRRQHFASEPWPGHDQDRADIDADTAHYGEPRRRPFDTYMEGISKHPDFDEWAKSGARLAVDTSGMDDHAYGTGAGFSPYDSGTGRWRGEDEDSHRLPSRHWDPDTGYQADEYDEYDAEHQDDESGYKPGPVPDHDPGSEPGPDPAFAGGAPLPFGTPTYNPRSAPYDNITGRRLGFNRPRRRTADGEVAPAPVGAQQLMTQMFWPGHRVGLPYGQDMIRGTVTHVQPDGQVGVLYDDGQFMPESPGDIQRLY